MARAGRRMSLLSTVTVTFIAAGCARSAPAAQPQQSIAPSASIAVPDLGFDILVAAADSVLPKLGPPDEKFYVDDSTTAKVFDHIGANSRYTIISREQVVSCDGSTPVRGKRATMRVYGLFGDSASVAWSSTCSLARTGESEPRVSGAGGTYELIRAGDSWVVTAAGLNFEYE